MFNAVLMGRLVRDPETKATTTGSTYSKFSIAINNGKDKSGADKPATFVECSAFGKTGEFVMNYARKGARVCISAAMEVGTYQNKNTGENMLSVSAMVDTVELIDWPDKDQPQQALAHPAYPPQQQQYGAPPAYPQQAGQYGVPPQQAPAQQNYPPQQQQLGAPPAYPQQGYPQQQQLPVQQGYAPQQGQPAAAPPWSNSPI